MATKLEKKQDQQRAREILDLYAEQIQDGTALLFISQEFGKGLTDYLRVALTYADNDGKTQVAHLTWALAQIFEYSLRDRNGRHYLAISGYGYSKSDEIARSLAFYYGVDRIRYELN